MSRHHVVVTGANGMIGSNLIPRLVAKGREVTALVRAGSDRSRLHAVESRVQWVAGDITDPGTVVRLFAAGRPDLVYHLAATPFNPPGTPAAQHVMVNVLGTTHLLEMAKAHPGTRLVLAGSGAEYGSGSGRREVDQVAPNTVLGATKAAATLLAQSYATTHGVDAVVLRLFTPYGPWEHERRLIPQTIRTLLAGERLPMSAGAQQRDFVHVDDVVEAFLRAGDRPLRAGTVLNIGSGHGTAVRDVATRIARRLAAEHLLDIGALPTRPDEIMEMSANIDQARRELGWAPRIGLDEGIERSIAWGRTHAPEVSSHAR